MDSTHLLGLQDDCLLNILRFLAEEDWVTHVCYTCSRFGALCKLSRQILSNLRLSVRSIDQLTEALAFWTPYIKHVRSLSLSFFADADESLVAELLLPLFNTLLPQLQRLRLTFCHANGALRMFPAVIQHVTKLSSSPLISLSVAIQPLMKSNNSFPINQMIDCLVPEAAVSPAPIRYPHLQVLDIRIHTRSPDDFEQIDDPIFVRLIQHTPCLETFNINISVRFWASWNHLFLMERKWTQLKHINMPALSITCDEIVSLISELPALQEMHVKAISNAHQYRIDPIIFTEQAPLAASADFVQLRISGQGAYEGEVGAVLCTLLSLTRRSLRTLFLAYTPDSGRDQAELIDFSCVSTVTDVICAPSLKSLALQHAACSNSLLLHLACPQLATLALFPTQPRITRQLDSAALVAFLSRIEAGRLRKLHCTCFAEHPDVVAASIRAGYNPADDIEPSE